MMLSKDIVEHDVDNHSKIQVEDIVEHDVDNHHSNKNTSGGYSRT